MLNCKNLEARNILSHKLSQQPNNKKEIRLTTAPTKIIMIKIKTLPLFPLWTVSTTLPLQQWFICKSLKKLPFQNIFCRFRYFNLEPSFKLRWCRARDLFRSENLVTTGGFELGIFCVRSSYYYVTTKV